MLILAMCPENGENRYAIFARPTADPAVVQKTVSILGGSVHNGLSDKADLTITYSTKASPSVSVISTPAVNSGNKAVGPFEGVITSFNLVYPAKGKGLVSWTAPVEGVSMSKGMSVVVIGTYDAPSLAITLEIGGPQIVKLIKK